MDNAIRVCPLSMQGELKQCTPMCSLNENGKCLLAEALKRIANSSDRKN